MNTVLWFGIAVITLFNVNNPMDAELSLVKINDPFPTEQACLLKIKELTTYVEAQNQLINKDMRIHVNSIVCANPHSHVSN